MMCTQTKQNLKEIILVAIKEGQISLTDEEYLNGDEKTLVDNITDLYSRMDSKLAIPVNLYEKIFVVYHESDIDGHHIKLIHGLLKNGDFSDTFGCNIKADESYDIIKTKLEEGYFVIIADLSFTKEIAEKVDKELDTERIVLLDHHSSAMYMNDYNWALVVPHDEKELYLSSGTLLYTMYIYSNFVRDEYRPDNLIVHLAMCTAFYDTWFWSSNFDYTRELVEENYETYPEDLNMLFKTMSKEKYVQHIYDNIKEVSNVFNKEDLLKISFMRSTTMKTVYRFYHNMRVVDLNGKKIGIVFGDNEASATGNFILRANRELSYFAMINLNANAVYLRSREDYDVKEIAVRNNGGGHPQAAGFSIDDTFCGKRFLVDILNMYLEENVPESFSVQSIKDIAEFDSEEKVYKFK